MNKEDLLKRIDDLSSLSFGSDTNSEFRIQEMFHGALDIMIILYGQASVQLQSFIREEETIREKFVGSTAIEHRRQLTIGVLQNMKSAIGNGIIESFQKSITGEVLSDFLQLARTVFDQKGDDAKNVASVLAAALFEDTLRRIAILNGIPHIEKLQDVIQSLRTKVYYKGPKLV